MAFLAAFRRRMRELARSENGMALPTAVFAMVASIGFGTAAVMSSVNVQHGTQRDRNSKNAIAAADAGANVALLRLNRFQGSLGAGNPCVGPAGEPLPPEPSGWCPAIGPEGVGDATFSYQVSGYQPGGELSVVAVGDSGSVSRRIEVGLVSYNGEEVFADERLIGQDGIDLEGTPDVRTDVGTNGDIESDGSGTLCGDVRHGVGKSAPDPDCDGGVTEGNKELPPIIPPEGIETDNSNCRLELTCPNPSEVDTYATKSPQEKRTATNPWDASTRTINVNGNATLTMGGGDYFVCGLFIENGQLIMAGGAGVEVRIFFDTPENCGLSAGDTQVSITGNANIVSTGYKPEKGMFNVPGLYVIGSPDIPTRVDLSGNSGTNELILYAPYSDVEIGGNANWIGMIAGKTLRLHGTPTVESDPGINPPDFFYTSLWEPTRYVECTGPSATPPDASC
jgi:hypothetical protein